MGLADLHIHSIHSWDGTASISAILKHVAENTNLDVIAITDHDEIRGALQARDMAPRYGIGVIPGSEVSTADGHLLALFVEEKIPAGLSLGDTVRRIGALGGVCVVAHPMARGVSSVSAEVLRNTLQEPGVNGVLLGIEAINGGLFHRGSNITATALAHTLPVASVGNSDSHLLDTIGEAATFFPGITTTDLRTALENQRTEVHLEHVSGPMTIIGRWLVRFVLRSAGWVAWNPEPDQRIRLGRTSQIFAGYQIRAD